MTTDFNYVLDFYLYFLDGRLLVIAERGSVTERKKTHYPPGTLFSCLSLLHKLLVIFIERFDFFS